MKRSENLQSREMGGTRTSIPTIPISAAELRGKGFPDWEPVRRRFGGQRVRITGRLNFFQSINGQLNVNLGREELFCQLTAGGRWNPSMLGRVVTLEGVLPKESIFPGLQNCEIVEAIGEPFPKFTSRSLAQAFESDPFGFQKQYSQYTTNVRGMVDGIGPGVDGAVRIWLRDSLNTTIFCDFDKSESALIASLAEGDTVNLIGRCFPNAKKGEVRLSSCLFVRGDD